MLIPTSDGFSCVIDCPLNCSNCSNRICTNCLDGYYLSNGTCLAYACSSDCKLCNASGACLVCLNTQHTYNLTLNLCQKPSNASCGLYCSVCKVNSTKCE